MTGRRFWVGCGFFSWGDGGGEEELQVTYCSLCPGRISDHVYSLQKLQPDTYPCNGSGLPSHPTQFRGTTRPSTPPSSYWCEEDYPKAESPFRTFIFFFFAFSLSSHRHLMYTFSLYLWFSRLIINKVYVRRVDSLTLVYVRRVDSSDLVFQVDVLGG